MSPLEPELTEPIEPSLRHSFRTIRPPLKLKDFHTNLVTQKSFNRKLYKLQLLSKIYQGYIFNTYIEHEQKNFHEANQNPKWSAPMDQGVAGREKNKSWKLVSLPKKKQL